MVDEKSIEIMEIEEETYKPQKSLIEKMDDCKKEIAGLRAENEHLRDEISDMKKRTCYSEEYVKTLQGYKKELEGENQQLSNENYKLERMTCGLKSDLERVKIAREQTSNSEDSLKQINEELAKENEELKKKLRDFECDGTIKMMLGEELESKKCEIALINNCLKTKVRKTDWAMSQIDNHLQMISSILNHTREEVVV